METIIHHDQSLLLICTYFEKLKHIVPRSVSPRDILAYLNRRHVPEYSF